MYLVSYHMLTKSSYLASATYGGIMVASFFAFGPIQGY